MTFQGGKDIDGNIGIWGLRYNMRERDFKYEKKCILQKYIICKSEYIK